MSDIQALLLTAYAIVTGFTLAIGLWCEEGSKLDYICAVALGNALFWILMFVAIGWMKVFNLTSI